MSAPPSRWAGLSNTDLLDAAEQAAFDALVTSDQNMVSQQNLAGRNIAVVVLSTNDLPTIRSQPQRLRHAVANASPGTFSVAPFGRPRRFRPTSDLKC
jgi:hypothetical protein